MKSRLLLNLEAVCRNPTSDLELYQAKAKTAAHLGKLGETERAKSLLAELRSIPGAASDASVVSLVNFAEGLIEFRSGRSIRGVDKWMRARALASSVNYQEGSSMAAAWLAFDAYLREDLRAMDRFVRAALLEGYPSVPPAIARTSLILALYCHYCADDSRARKYYELSHRFATASGDEVEIASLIHNMSAMVIHEKRVTSLAEFSGVNRQSSWPANLSSADSYEQLIGIRSLRSLSPQLGAYEAVLEERWAAALQLIDEALASTESDGYARLMPTLLSERALCHFMMGGKSAAQRDLDVSLEARSCSALHRDDEALYFSRLTQVYRLLGSEELAAKYAEYARSAWAEVDRFQSEIREVVDSIDEAVQAAINGRA